MTTETTTGLGLQRFGDGAFRALTALQDTVKEQDAMRDGGGYTVLGSLHHTVNLRREEEGPTLLTVSVQLWLPEGHDMTWMAFKACSYALYTVCREKIRPTLVWDGTRRFVPPETTVSAKMKIGEARMRLTVVVA